MIESSEIIIPKAYYDKIQQDPSLTIIVNHSKLFVERLIKYSTHFFFGEYTNHGIDHINQVLNKSEEIITNKSLEILDSKNISILILSIFFHDIGMNLNLEFFNSLISKDLKWKIHELDNESYYILWQDYKDESIHWKDEYKIKLFGSILNPKRTDYYELNEITEIERKYIGEFIRRHHPRIAHDLILNGYQFISGNVEHVLDISSGSMIQGDGDLFYEFKELVGLVARSHGMDLRVITNFLKERDSHNWMNYLGVKTTYLMAVIRIADYLLIDSKRISSSIFLFKEFFSPISIFEFQKHGAIIQGAKSHKDKETYRFTVQSNIDNDLYLGIKSLFLSIQNELDKTWAIIGESYSLQSTLNDLLLAYRRINSNLDDPSYTVHTNKVYGEAKLKLNKNLFPLLSRKLYASPKAGIRELLQNAVDACKVRRSYDQAYKPEVSILLNNATLEIIDNGVGMNLYDINEYLFKIGNSGKIVEYKTEDLTGRFGIGFLAGFLLGDCITYNTRKIGDECGYKFTVQMNDDLTKNVTIIKDKNSEIGTSISIPIERKNITPFITNMSKYLDYSGEIPIKSEIDLEFTNYRVCWRKIEDKEVIIKWTYRRRLDKRTTSRNANYLNDFMVANFKVKNKALGIFKSKIVYNIIDKNDICTLNLSREIGEITLPNSSLKKLKIDLILDSYLYLLSLPNYKTLKYSPSYYPALVRRDVEDIIVYGRDGYNFLSNLESGLFDLILEYKSTIRKDISVLKQLAKSKPKVLVIYNSIHNMELSDDEYNKSKDVYRTKKVVNKEDNWLLDHFELDKIEAVFKFNEIKEIFEIRKSEISLSNEVFKNRMIPYKIEDRKIEFQKLFQKYGPRIDDFKTNWI